MGAKINELYSEVSAHLRGVKISPRKLNLVAGLLRNMKVAEALLQLTFMNKKIARDVKKCLQSAIANAEHNKNLDIDSLYVKRAIVGKAFVLKRMHARARGRSGKIRKYYSNLTITVAEYEE